MRRFLHVVVGLGAVALLALAACSGDDAELEARLAAIQESMDGQRWDEAVETARSLVEEWPDDARARARLGTTLLGKSRTEEQVLDPARFEQAKAADDPAAFFDPGLFRTETTFDDGLRAEAEAEFLRVLDMDPSILEAHLGLAAVHVERGDFPAEKRTIADAAVRFAGDEDAGSRLLSFGERHFREGEYEEALEIFTLLTASFPDSPAAKLDHAASLFATGEYDQGIRVLEESVDEGPAHENARRTLGQMYMFRQEWRKAADVFAALAAEQPTDRLTPVHHAASLMPIDPEAAAEILKGVLGADPERTERATAIANNLHLALGENVPGDDLVRLAGQLNQFQLPQLAAAVSGYILHRDPDSVPGRVILAHVYDTMRYHDMALAQLDEAVEIVRRDPGAASPFTESRLAPHYGRVYFNMEEWEEAAEAFSRADDLGPMTLAAGIASENVGDYEVAYRYFQEVVGSPGPAGVIQRAEEHLAKEHYAELRQGS